MKIRVLQVLEATTGGTRTHLFDLVTRLDPDRFELSVICATRRDPDFLYDLPRMRAAGAEVRVVPMVRAIRPVRDLCGLLRIYAHVRRRGCDVVHTHSAKAGFLGRLAARLAGVRAVVHTPHVFPFQMDVPAVARTTYFLLEKLVAPLTDRFVCVCPGEAALAREWGLAPARRLVVIENGISLRDHDALRVPAAAARAALGLAPGQAVVGSVGRFVRQKGLPFLVEAAAMLAPRFPALRVVLVGDGPRRPDLERRLRRLGLAGRFVLTGAREDARRLLDAMDVVAMPSLWEGLPYSLLEAMASSRPVVAAAVGGVPDVLRDGENGLLVPPKDAAALADALGALLADGGRRQRLGEAARRTVERHFHVDDMVQRTAQLYESLLETHARPGV